MTRRTAKNMRTTRVREGLQTPSAFHNGVRHLGRKECSAGELDSKPMRRDWEETLEIARELGDKKWQNRASGEIGFANFLDGDLRKAQQRVAATRITATRTGDVGAQIRYLAAIGSVLAMTGQPDQALHYLDRAARVAE